MARSLIVQLVLVDGLEGKKYLQGKIVGIIVNSGEEVKKEVVKLLDAGVIYPISDKEWVSPVQVVPKKVV